MKKGTMTKEQAIAIVGVELVDKLDAENCGPTNRVGYNGACQGDDKTEHSASISLEDGRVLMAYYYTSNEQDQVIAEANGDGSVIYWEITGYEIY